MEIALKMLAALIAGIAGGMGLGGGTLLVLYLDNFTTLNQKQMQGVNLVFFLPVALCSVIILLLKKQIKLKPILVILPLGVLGCLAGGLLLPQINGAVLKKCFAALLILVGVKELFSKQNIRS